jgi:predicted RNA-binding protein with PUA-like domain
MAYWLMKSEPDVFSIDDLKRKGVAGWDGVRNYQARNFMRAMKTGDQVLFYHSSTKPSAIVGIMEIVKEAYPDPTQFDPKNDHYDSDSLPENPRWSQVDVKYVRTFAQALSLDAIRKMTALQNMVLLKRGRLSVQPVTAGEWKLILSLGG